MPVIFIILAYAYVGLIVQLERRFDFHNLLGMILIIANPFVPLFLWSIQ